MQKTHNLQDLFLARARRDKANVTMFLMNGYQLKGQIAGFDAFVVVLRRGTAAGHLQARISTIVPERAVPLAEEARD